MLEVKPNKEILKIRNRMYLGFSGYEAFMLVSGIITGTLLFIILPFHPMFNTFIMASVIAGFVSMGLISINNMPLPVFLITLIKNRKICRKEWYFESEEVKNR